MAVSSSSRTYNLFCWFALNFICISLKLNAQETTFYTNDVKDNRKTIFALTNAKVYIGKDFQEDITLIISQGSILNIGKNIAISKDYLAIDMKGMTIYPGFIDLYSEYGLNKTISTNIGRNFGGTPQTTSNKKGAYAWNEALKSEYNAIEEFKVDSKSAKEYRTQGFTKVLTHRMDGISRGTGALVNLGESIEHRQIVKEKIAHILSFRKGSSQQDYPSSLMGSIALLRQTYLDGKWYSNDPKLEEKNLSLEAWNRNQTMLQIFEASEKFDIFRANKIGQEFNTKYIYKGNGDEYQRSEEIAKLGVPLILPLNFPEAYDVEDPYKANVISLTQMKHWEMAPSNPAILERKNIVFALTSFGQKEMSQFIGNLRKAVKYGLSQQKAIEALTMVPAKFAGIDKITGSIEVGKDADLIIAGGNIFDEKTKVYEVWVKGERYIEQIAPVEEPNVSNFKISVPEKEFNAKITNKNNSPELAIKQLDTVEWKGKIKYENETIQLMFPSNAGSNNADKQYRLNGKKQGTNYDGYGYDPQGQWIKWSATLLNSNDSLKSVDKKKAELDTSNLSIKNIYPFASYGSTEIKNKKPFLIKNTTVWTGEEPFELKSIDVYLDGGQIKAIGKSLNFPSATLIDGTNKILTAGIIDEHSHIAITRGVNEGTQSSSAEVRIGDVLNSEDVNIYRQLAGGVTAAQLLHGSANPVGGQSALVKLKWGVMPEELKITGAKEFIKFALGENVKQSNWGDNTVFRFPQSRMGVEQWYVDYFTRSREYGEKIKSGKFYKKDLDLETGLEILNGQRFITCHSYVQSEINMLMKVAEKFNFRINTFTHILEGYKLADKMASHGCGASTFADWWMYKYEVIDAIPQNAGILTKEKVVTAINSDDAEMARRLNQEAAKSIKYTNMSQENAWKMVTANPAKLLHLDHRMGSVKVGKDADIVLWSDNPLSVYAKAEKTWVDGVLYFDIEKQTTLEKEIAEERNRLIQKMIKEKQAGSSVQAARGPIRRHYHCDDIECEVE